MPKLKTLIECRKLDIESFLSITNLNKEVIHDENFRESLSSDQLNLVAEVLGVPRFVLASKSFPQIDSLPQDFRTVGNKRARHTKSSLKAIYTALNEAKVINRWAETLGDDRETVSIWDSHNPAKFSASKVADDIREFLGIDLGFFQRFEDDVEALNSFRYRIEESGIHVFMEEFSDHAIRGFCFKEDDSFFLCLNSERQHVRAKIFTLAHELAHIAFGRVGIVDVHSSGLKLERACNRVAAHLLLPDNLLKEIIARLTYSPDLRPKTTVNKLHGQLPFSKYFLAIRLQEFGYPGFVEEWAAATGYPIREASPSVEELRTYNEEADKFEADEDQQDAFRMRGQPLRHFSRLGFIAISVASHAINTGLVSTFDVQRSLGLPAKYYEKTLKKYKDKMREAQKYG